MAATKVKLGELGEAIVTELNQYHEGVVHKVNKASKKAAESLRDKTQVSAPFDTGEFSSNIDCKMLERNRLGNEKHVWYVKPPLHRVTHLLVHGHFKENGERVDGDPFLHNAWDAVRKKYEQDVEEAVKSD